MHTSVACAWTLDEGRGKRAVAYSDIFQLVDWPVSEGATRSCEDDAPQASFWQALNALEQSRVLRIGWQNVHAVLLGKRKHSWAASNQCLLVRQADVLASFNRGTGGLQASAAYNSRHHSLDIRVRSDSALPLNADQNFWLAGSILDELLQGLHVIR